MTFVWIFDDFLIFPCVFSRSFFWDYDQNRRDIWRNWAGIVSHSLACDTSSAFLILLKNKKFEITIIKTEQKFVSHGLACDTSSAFLILLKQIKSMKFPLTKLSKNCFTQFSMWHQLGVFIFLTISNDEVTIFWHLFVYLMTT